MQSQRTSYPPLFQLSRGERQAPVGMQAPHHGMDGGDQPRLTLTAYSKYERFMDRFHFCDTPKSFEGVYGTVVVTVVGSQGQPLIESMKVVSAPSSKDNVDGFKIGWMMSTGYMEVPRTELEDVRKEIPDAYEKKVRPDIQELASRGVTEENLQSEKDVARVQVAKLYREDKDNLVRIHIWGNKTNKSFTTKSPAVTIDEVRTQYVSYIPRGYALHLTEDLIRQFKNKRVNIRIPLWDEEGQYRTFFLNEAREKTLGHAVDALCDLFKRTPLDVRSKITYYTESKIYNNMLLDGTGRAVYEFFMHEDNRAKWGAWSIQSISMDDKKVSFMLQSYKKDHPEIRAPPSEYSISTNDRHYVYMNNIGENFMRLTTVPYTEHHHEFTLDEKDAIDPSIDQRTK